MCCLLWTMMLFYRMLKNLNIYTLEKNVDPVTTSNSKGDNSIIYTTVNALELL